MKIRADRGIGVSEKADLLPEVRNLITRNGGREKNKMRTEDPPEI
jgi:hypothetical protein